MEITQVYGWLVDGHGRVMARIDDGHWGLPGGTPELYDSDRVATLVREVDEEVQVRIADPVYLGYQEVLHPNHRSHAQLRMVARITELLPRRPDPDNGRIHGRILASFDAVLDGLNWGPSTEGQAECARRIAEARWGLPVMSPTAGPALD
ncbi:NUDIX hydrolase [Nocardiopsis gilva YIM 90087]|uniref:NUDIX hydrolase n=2 Tax=Nocardiopsis gilva TaxID=280236 RepID=A0A223SDK5_9ACTN|nr:NUDIX hydrolase [Nocardiopsis gilva YIM 90087]